MSDNKVPIISGDLEDRIKAELSHIDESTAEKALEKFGMAALGAIPWVGGFIAAGFSLVGEDGTSKANRLQFQWLEEHQRRMEELQQTLNEMGERITGLGDEVFERLGSEEYLNLIRKGFRQWDEADTDEKKRYIRLLLTNAVGIKLVEDDWVRQFLDWINTYHEAHFAIVAHIYKNTGSTRYDIWTAIHGELVPENSAEADLYRMLIRDLSTGGVIRQERQTTHDGQFLKTPRSKRTGPSSNTMESSFERTKRYELSELGQKFVHYTMEDVVTRIENADAPESP